MKHNNHFKAIASLLILILAFNLSAQNKAKNILFIAVDDLKPLLSNYGHKEMHTPNFDRLANMGVTFTHAYVQQAVCGPSRASVMTGTPPDRTRVWDLHTNFREANPNLVSMPEYLTSQGYETTAIGKIYHKGSASPGHDGKSWSIPHIIPRDYDPKYGEPALEYYQKPETKKEIERLAKELVSQGVKGGLRTKIMKRIKPSTEMVDVSDEAYQDGIYTKEALKRMRKLAKGDKPFFLGVGFQKPHLPFIAPKKYWDLYDRDKIKLSPQQSYSDGTPKIAYHTYGELRAYTDIPNKVKKGVPLPEDKQRQLIHGYMAAVSYIDAQLGKILDEYERLGLDKNTIIVLWGDHGYHLGDHTLWCKHSNFEQATRIPFMFAGPGIEKNIKIDHPVELVDLFPTVFDLVDVKPSKQAEGISLAPLMDGNNRTSVDKDYAISQYHRPVKTEGYSIRTDRYRYTEWHANNYHSYLPYSDNNIVATELYDYKSAPTEPKNLIDDPDMQNIKAELKAKLRKHLSDKQVYYKSNGVSSAPAVLKGKKDKNHKRKKNKKNKKNKKHKKNKKNKKGKANAIDQLKQSGKASAQTMKNYNSKTTALINDKALDKHTKSNHGKPNILIIHVDDLGYHDLSCKGSVLYNTPNIDKLSQESVNFTNAYASYPRCVPSRYGMMTANYPVNENKGHLEDIPEEQNFVKQFDKAGYNTYYIGKWHLGKDKASPKGFGYTDSYAAGEAGGIASRLYPFNIQRKNGKPGKYIVPDVEEDGKEGDYAADLLTDATIDFIKNNPKDKPFLAVLAFYAVHTPIEAKPEDEARNKEQLKHIDFGDTPEYTYDGCRAKMRQDNPAYAGMVENVDENVSRLLNTLKELGIDDNTIIVLSSDHGGLSNSGLKKNRELATTNFPLRAGKGWLYEGGIRVPLFVKWGHHFEPRLEDKSIVLGMDVFPTLLDLALNKKVDGVDGLSYKNVLEGKDSWEDRAVFWNEKKARPRRTGEHNSSVVRSGDYKLLHFFDDNRIELYNIKKDISESNDLSGQMPDKVNELMTLLKDWQKKHNVDNTKVKKDKKKKKGKKKKKHKKKHKKNKNR